MSISFYKFGVGFRYSQRLFFVRVFGWGFLIKDISRHPLLYSQCQHGVWMTWLRPIK